jgi:hypothetical protein
MIEYTNLTGRYRFSGLCRACLPRAKVNPILIKHGHIVHELAAALSPTTETPEP